MSKHDYYEQIAATHPRANDPYEPYSGVTALFNADLHRGCPEYAPREDWEVISSFEIRQYNPSPQAAAYLLTKVVEVQQ